MTTTRIHFLRLNLTFAQLSPDDFLSALWQTGELFKHECVAQCMLELTRAPSASIKKKIAEWIKIMENKNFQNRCICKLNLLKNHTDNLSHIHKYNVTFSVHARSVIIERM